MSSSPLARARLRLRTLGGLSLESAGRPLTGAALQPRRLAVLAVLAAAGERGLTRAKLLGLLWPETDESRGRQALSQALYALRRDCGTAPLVAGSELLRLDPAVVASDVAELEAAAAGDDRERIATLHPGPFLDGVYVAGAPEFERWAEERRAHYAGYAERAIEQLATDADARGDWSSAALWWRRLTALDPLRTSAALGAVRALAASGQRADALRHAEQYARQVREELDAEPNADVQALAQSLRGESSRDRDDATHALAGRYVLERELGRGGMAVVHLARDLRHARPVAVKMLHRELGATLGRERLEREIVVTAALRHPHILPLFDSGEADGTLFYVMPYVDGESLRARLSREGTFAIDDAVRLAREVAEALHHAHLRGVVHRDVKPENILLSEAHAVVMDFGIARTLADAAAETLTQQGIALGTPAYMSPEQVAGERELDARSDLYALACVLFEMLAGRPPWLGTTAHAVLARRFVHEPPSLQELRADVPAALAAEVRRALAVDPADRHESAEAFARALGRATASTDLAPEDAAAALPMVPGDLVGREREVTAAGALLARRDVRLLTLTGAAGSGKTRLALQLADHARGRFAAGARWVDLSATIDPERVLPAIASALGVRETEGRPPLESVAAHIGACELLLLLDNLEQVAGAAPSLARLLALCPHLTIVATSRVRLRIRGEHEFFVAPLQVPDLAGSADVDALAAIPSVDLFLRRAAEASDEFAAAGEELRAVAEICVRLDGLPLAIELAAARCRLLSPRQVLARMDHRFELLTGGARDLPSRQQTLRGAIAWSFDLLEPPERRVLRHLAIFAGGATLDAALSVLGGTEAELLENVLALADASVLRRAEDAAGDVRLVMLESVREFALEQLRAEAEEQDARDRHRDVFAALAERLSGELNGAKQADALAVLDRERDNFRVALEHAARSGGDAFARLVLSLWRVWLVRGRWTEGRDWIARAATAGDLDPALLARLLTAATTLAQNQGDYPAAYDSAERALALWRQLGDRAGEARTLASMGWLAWRLCRFAESRGLSEESLALHRALGDDGGVAQAINNIGWTTLFEGDAEEAVRRFEDSLAIRRALGDRRNVAFTLTTLGWALSRRGDTVRARTLLDEAQATFDEIGERQLLAFNVRVIAMIDVVDGRAAEALRALETVSIPVFRSIGDRWGLCVALGVLGDALWSEGRLEEATRAHDESMELATAIGDRVWMATGLARRVAAAGARGEHAVALELADEVERLLGEIGAPLPAENRAAYERAVGAARAARGAVHGRARVVGIGEVEGSGNA